ncbi:class I SAM-dependent methyltransferase [Mesorhizobium atlanticum]|uniref:Methyltransferase type 11 domain-containing protein n=1 Tax=Mesorhizobium atlanticum TaxID=2233532 RepID=A0A330GK86_9HYPH|nr:class I SAM-dependent methyltransferase [Mesorhizobium atlanticum]RAZ72912.1 hypothetical protein DPM35_26295 [Mesorhizobium atlanticum]
MTVPIKQAAEQERFGDFTHVSQNYRYRPYYSYPVFEYIASRIRFAALPLVAADIGAGSGKLVEMLARMGFSGFAVEPNREMLKHGREECSYLRGFSWLEATAEKTGLDDRSVSWVCMGSMFHWTISDAALAECHRILRPGGFLSVVYDLTDIRCDPFQTKVENLIRKRAPGVKRAREPIEAIMPELETILSEAPGFKECVFVEAAHVELMDVERYMRVWDTAHDLRGQLSMSEWNGLKASIVDLARRMDEIPARYRTSAWTVQRV